MRETFWLRQFVHCRPPPTAELSTQQAQITELLGIDLSAFVSWFGAVVRQNRDGIFHPDNLRSSFYLHRQPGAPDTPNPVFQPMTPVFTGKADWCFKGMKQPSLDLLELAMTMLTYRAATKF